MKKLIFLLVIGVTMYSLPAFSQSTFVTRNQGEKFQKTVSTSSATATVIDTIPVSTNENGLIEIKVIGYNEANAAAFVGVKRFNYKKASGTLTVPVAALDSIQNTGIGGAGFTITATAFNNLQTKVIGAAATNVKWVSITKQYFRKGD